MGRDLALAHLLLDDFWEKFDQRRPTLRARVGRKPRLKRSMVYPPIDLLAILPLKFGPRWSG